jgi:hypothetical protein
MEWISTKDRQPQDLQGCLFITNTDTFPEANSGYYYDLFGIFVCNVIGYLKPDQYEYCQAELTFKKDDVLYWMPLPEPPNE